MSDKVFYRLLAVVLTLCLLGTAAMVGWTAYLRENCSIIGYIAGER